MAEVPEPQRQLRHDVDARAEQVGIPELGQQLEQARKLATQQQQAAQQQALAATAPAAEVRFHYEDLDAAVRFYREHLGLVPVETREDAVVLEVAPGAFLTLATLASGGYGADTPRTAAIASRIARPVL